MRTPRTGGPVPPLRGASSVPTGRAIYRLVKEHRGRSGYGGLRHTGAEAVDADGNVAPGGADLVGLVAGTGDEDERKDRCAGEKTVHVFHIDRVVKN